MRFIVAKAAAASLLLSSLQSGALASTCPENLDSSVEIDKASSSILHYSIVAPESGSPGVLCARLESGIEGWYASSFLRSNQQTSYLLYQFRLPPRIGVGFTDTGKMNNNGSGWAVIGTGGQGGSVKKYRVSGYGKPQEMEGSKQTLEDTSLEQSGGKTVMTFTKLLAEAGEQEISTTGPNKGIHAGLSGNNNLAYHMGHRFSFTLNAGGEAASSSLLSSGSLNARLRGSLSTVGVSLESDSEEGRFETGTPEFLSCTNRGPCIQDSDCCDTLVCSAPWGNKATPDFASLNWYKYCKPPVTNLTSIMVPSIK